MDTENVRFVDLQIKGVTSVRELKEEITQLRDRLVQLDNTSEEYSKVVDELIIDQTKLKEVMSAGKEATKGLKGSYNAYVNEMSALKKVWREVTSEAERSRIGERISFINEELKRMDSTIGNNQRRVGSYEDAFKKALLTPQQELRKLRIELAGLKEGTEEYNATFARMAQLTHDVQEQQEMLKWSSADLGDILGNLAGVAQGIAGGFSAINALSGLMGNDGALDEGMLKAQQFLQLIQGLGALEELGDKIKGLWEGLKNYGKTQTTATIALQDFGKNAKTSAIASSNATAQIDGQASSMHRASVSANEITEALKRQNAIYEQSLFSIKSYQTQLDELNVKLDANAKALSDNAIQASKLSAQKGLSRVQYHNSKDPEVVAIKERQKAIVKERNVLIQQKQAIEQKMASQAKSTQITKADTTATKVNTTAQNANTTAQNAGAKSAEGLATATATASVATKGLSSALTLLKGALISTGIGALIVAIGTLIGYVIEWSKSLWDVLDGTTAVNASVEYFTKVIDDLNWSLSHEQSMMENQIKLMEAQGDSYEEIYQYRIKNIESMIEHTSAVISDIEASIAHAQALGKEAEEYTELTDQLNELIATRQGLREQIIDLTYDKMAHEIKETKKAEQERQRVSIQAYQQRMKQIDQEREQAKKLYNETINYFKDEKTKLKEKYEEEKKLLEKYGFDTTNLTKKYEKEKTKIVLEEMKARYEQMRTYNDKINSLLSPEELLKTQVESAMEDAEIWNEYADYISKGFLPAGVMERFNAEFGLSMKYLSDFEVEMKLANKAVEDAEKALLEFQSEQLVTKLTKEMEAFGITSENTLKQFEMNLEKMGSESFHGFYSGLSPKQLQTALEERYALLESQLQAEIDIYKRYVEELNLTDEDRANMKAHIAQLEMQKTDLVTQKTIESNNLIIDNYNNMANGITGIAGSISDILGSVSDMIMDNAERQLEAGEITEAEYNRQFEKNKSIQIAIATINTIAGALGAFMGITKDTGGWGIGLAIAQATAVFASGMAQINAIKNTQPNSSSSSNARYATAIPLPNDYLPQGSTNLTGSQETENLANALSKTPIKAYVVESEITKAQNISRQRTKEATF